MQADGEKGAATCHRLSPNQNSLQEAEDVEDEHWRRKRPLVAEVRRPKVPSVTKQIIVAV